MTKPSGPLWLLAVLGSSAGCIATYQGLGPVIRPVGGAEDLNGRVTVSGGGGPDAGVIQTTLSAVGALADWFGLEVGVTADGVYDGRNEPLRQKQDLTMNWGLWPFVAPTFYIGPVDLRVILFGIGGGGPEGPGGYMGLIGGSLGYRLDGMQMYAGFTAQAVFGCCEGEYTGVSYQVPVGFVFEEIPLTSEGEGACRLGLELVWARNSAGNGGVSSADWDSVTLFTTVTFDGGD